MIHHESKILQANLLAWFDANGRCLPWRVKHSLYGVWISEIMLQQTTVAVVIPFWEKFMLKFPNVQALATAPESEILSCWSGLGYYRRARNLHRAARQVMNHLGGQLPSSCKQWQGLPGIGAYTSGAIASIGLGEAVPAVDANARRVLSRWFFDDPVAAGNLQPAALEKIGAAVVSLQRPGHWNEAVMELGAVLCRATTLDCGKCPVLDQCKAGLKGNALEIPPSKKKEPAIAVVLAILVVRQGGKILILPPGKPENVSLPGHWELGRDDISGLHQGLWTLPSSPWYLAGESVGRALQKPGFVGHWLKKRFGFSSHQVKTSTLSVAAFNHSITKFRLKVTVWDIQFHEDRNQIDLDTPFLGRFVNLSPDLPVSKLVTKCLKMFSSGNV